MKSDTVTVRRGENNSPLLPIPVSPRLRSYAAAYRLDWQNARRSSASAH
jgi:hypothetical protein